MSALLVLRIRGHTNVRHTIETTLESLNLTRANHAIVVPETPHFVGMVRKVKDYVTFGPATAEQVEKLIRERGRLVGDKPVTDAYVKEHSDFGSVKELAAAVAAGKALYKDLEGVKPIFRLNPPKKGFKGGIKRSYRAHGSLGDRGEAVTELIERMI